jgi:phosphohistidine phosphatase SixA
VEVYFVSHAQGEPDDNTAGGRDTSIPSSEQCRRRGEAVVGLLRGMGISLDRIFTSPLPLAQETTGRIVTAWGASPPPVTECPPLSPGIDPLALTRFIRDSGGQAVALVGSEEDLSNYASWLIGGDSAQIDLTEGALAALTFRDKLGEGNGVLIWVIQSADIEKGLPPRPPA